MCYRYKYKAGYYKIHRSHKQVLVAQSFPALCDPMDCSLPGFSVRRILQARILEWVAIPFSRASSHPRDWAWISCIACRFFLLSEPPGKPTWPSNPTTRSIPSAYVHACSVIQSCLTLCDPIDYSSSGSSVYGIFQARILKWVAISSSRESSWPRDWTWFPEALEMASRFFTTEPSGKPSYSEKTIIQKVPCTPVFTEALFTIARTWK